MVSPALIFGQSTGGLLLGQTSKAAATSKLGWELARFGIRVGTAVGSVLLGYKYLVESGLIERGAEQFGTGYGTGLPKAYYQAQTEVLPKLKELEAQEYVRQSPVYSQVEIENIWREAEAKAQAYQYYSPYYTGSPSATEKANTKMPYTPRIM